MDEEDQRENWREVITEAMATTEQTCVRFASSDGIPIAAWRCGHGSPLLLVHGTGADHTRWAPVLAGLAERFTVYALDRRGRGASGDGPTWSIRQETEDLIAVLEAIGGQVDVVAHSFGAARALEAALLTDHIRRLVAYEPGGVRLPGSDHPSSLVGPRLLEPPVAEAGTPTTQEEAA